MNKIPHELMVDCTKCLLIEEVRRDVRKMDEGSDPKSEFGRL